MVSLGRWTALGGRRGFRRSRRDAAPDAPPAASLALALEQLCAQLGRPFSSAEIRAAAPPAAAGLTAGGVLLAAERLGFKARQVKPGKRTLAQIPPPFLMIGHRPGEGWRVRARVGDHLVLVDPVSQRESVTSLDAVADLAAGVVLLKPMAEAARQQRWRDPIMRRLRPVLWSWGSPRR